MPLKGDLVHSSFDDENNTACCAAAMLLKKNYQIVNVRGRFFSSEALVRMMYFFAPIYFSSEIFAHLRRILSEHCWLIAFFLQNYFADIGVEGKIQYFYFYYLMNFGTKLCASSSWTTLSDKIFRRTKFSALNRNFGSFVRRKCFLCLCFSVSEDVILI